MSDPTADKDLKEIERADAMRVRVVSNIAKWVADGGGSFRTLCSALGMGYEECYKAGGMAISNALCEIGAFRILEKHPDALLEMDYKGKWDATLGGTKGKGSGGDLAGAIFAAERKLRGEGT